MKGRERATRFGKIAKPLRVRFQCSVVTEAMQLEEPTTEEKFWLAV